MTIKTIVGRVLRAFDEIVRISGMSLILYPAAYLLPRKITLWLANVPAFWLLFSPKSSKHAYRQMRHGFGKGRLGSLYLAFKWLRQPFRDFVVLSRVANKRENMAQWKVVEKNVAGINVLRESNDSYIVASGHFLREVILCMFNDRITPGHPIHVAVDVPERIRSLYDLRIYIQFGLLLKMADYLEKEIEVLFVGKHSFKTILGRLGEQGNVLFLHIDAPWPADRPGAFTRPFAGYQERSFASGAARLARLAQCPVISCVYSLEKDGTMIIEWGEPIYTKKDDDDIKNINKLLDSIEIAIGERPAQYILNIGKERHWNSDKKCWEPVPK